MTGIGYWRGIGLCGLAVFCCGAMAQEGASGEPGTKWGSHLDFEAKPGSKRSLGEADLFIPVTQDGNTLVFSNLRGRFDNNSGNEGNLGLGLRRMLEGGWNLGVYGYLDRRRSETGNYFNQATLGAEALGVDWDFRANAYLPQGERVRTLSTSVTVGIPTAALVGNVIQVTTPGNTTTTTEESSLKGYDAEVGWRLPFFNAEDRSQMRLYLGGYRFYDSVTTVSGPRLRAELAMSDLPQLWRGAELLLGAEAQHDNVRGSQNFMSVRLRVPLSGEQPRPGRLLSQQERRMTAPVMRDVDVVTNARTVSATAATQVETATATTGGQTLTVVNSATTTTTAALNTALATAGANTVILSGTFNTNAQVNMAAGQTLIGGGSLTVSTPSGRTAVLSLPGATIAAATNSTQNALRMASNATLIGMTVTNDSNFGGSSSAVSAQGLAGVTIRNSTLATTGPLGGYALDARTTTNAVIAGNTITANPSGGVAIGIWADSANNITIAGNTITTTTPGAKYTVIGNQWTVFAAGSTGNVAVGGTCIFVGGAPTGSVGFTGGATCP